MRGVALEEGFAPGDVGAIVALHGAHYARRWNFGVAFEAKVAACLGVFAQRCGPDDLVLVARDSHGVSGSLILDLADPDADGRGARVRWFILADRLRGAGLGREMMARAVARADARSDGAAWLTTFSGLDAARLLYERAGFRLAHEAQDRTWGATVLEQEFRRPGRRCVGQRASGDRP